MFHLEPTAETANDASGRGGLSARLKVAFTPDPDDAYAWWAVAVGRLRLAGHAVDHTPRPIDEINRACRQEYYDIAAISSAAYPGQAEDYALMSAGASVGRGYGPALAARSAREGEPAGMAIGDGPVAIPGETTTGALLLRLFYPGVRTVALPCSEVAGAVLRGDVRAGVLIHEELLNWEGHGLRRIECLGARWQRTTGLPIPVGLVVARRGLGPRRLEAINRDLRLAMHAAQMHDAEARGWAMKFSHAARASVGARYLGMFANQDTFALGPDCLEALRLLYAMARQAGLIAREPELTPVDSAARREAV